MFSPAEGREPSLRASAAAPATSVRGVLFVLALSTLLSQLGTSIVNVGLPTIMRAFQTRFSAVQWVILSYLLTVTAFVVGAGRLGDLVGKKRLFLAGLALFTLASVGCGVAPSLGVLLAARAAQGLGAAALMALTLAYVGDAVPKARAGSAMGLLAAIGSLGTTLGPSLGGLTIAALGWRWVFLLNAPLGLAAYLAARRYLPDGAPHADAGRAARGPRRGEFDRLGTLLLAATLVVYSLAMTLGQSRGLGDGAVVALLVAAGAGLAAFLVVQARTPRPLVALALFRSVPLSASLAASLLVSTVMMATLLLGPFFLSRGLGLSTRDVGLAMSVGPLVAALTGVPAGRVVDRVGARPTMVAGLACLAAGTLWLSRVSLARGAAGYLLPVGVMSAGYAFFQAPNNAAIMAEARPDQRGVVSSLLHLARNLGLVSGTALMGALFATSVRAPARTMAGVAGASSEAIAEGIRAAFRAATALDVAALLLAVAVMAQGGRREERAGAARG